MVNFLTGTQEEVTEKISKIMKNANYSDPTQTLLLHPPELCKIDHTIMNSNNAENSINCMPVQNG